MKITVLMIITLLVGCSKINIDISSDAEASGDYTLPMGACQAVPGRGVDACRVKEGQLIDSDWTLILPTGKPILNGVITVYYKDVTKTFSLTSSVITIPFKDLVGHPIWQSEDDGIAQVLAEIQYKGNTTPEVVRFRGIAFIIVTKPGYDVLPIDSGFQSWSSVCKIQYTTAGRTAISCQ